MKIDEYGFLDFDLTDLLVRPAQTFQDYCQSFQVVQGQYCKSGYALPHRSRLRFFLRDLLPCSDVLVALLGDRVVGTATGVLWSNAGLPSDKLFQREVVGLIERGRRVAETTKFASQASSFELGGSRVERSVVAQRLLRELFRWCRYNDVDDWLIVINPKHMGYYVGELGFELIGRALSCAHVLNHPGVLLRLDLTQLVQQSRGTTAESQALFFSEVGRECSHPASNPLESDQIALLLLMKPDLFLTSTEDELHAFRATFPDLSRKVLIFLEQKTNPEQAPRISPLPSMAGVYGISSLAPRLGSGRTQNFHLHDHLQLIFTVLEVRAASRGVALQTIVDNSVPEVVVADPHLLGDLVTTTLDYMIERADRPLAITCAVEMLKGRTGSVALGMNFRGAVERRVIDVIAGKVYRIGGEFELIKHGDHESRLAFSIPMRVPGEELQVIEFFDCRAGAAEGEEQLALQRSPQKFHGLIVEDNPVDATLLKRLLEKLNCRTTTASHGGEALELLEDQSFDFIIMDLQMPVLDGYATASEIQRRGYLAGSYIPIIAVTAFVFEGAAERCLEVGMEHFIAKPISFGDFFDVVTEVLLKTERARCASSGDVQRVMSRPTIR